LTEFDVHFSQSYNLPHRLERTQSSLASSRKYAGLTDAMGVAVVEPPMVGAKAGGMLMDAMIQKNRTDSDADSVLAQTNDLQQFTGEVKGSAENEKAITIGKYVRELTGRARNIMRTGHKAESGLIPAMLERHEHPERPDDPLFASLSSGTWNTSDYVGAGFEYSHADPIYTRYASTYMDSILLMENSNEEASRAEYEEYCKDVTLDCENVKEVYNQACEYHCSETLMSDRFKGLRQGVSARFVAACVAEQVDMLEHSENRGLRAEGVETMHQNLTQASLQSEGLVEMIHDRMYQLESERTTYQSMLHEDSLSSTLSTLADDDTFKMYCSFFDEDSLKKSAAVYHVNVAYGRSHRNRKGESPEEESADETEESALIEELVKENFDQADPEHFVRKTNEFMTFNKAGAYAAARSLLKYESALKDYQ